MLEGDEEGASGGMEQWAGPQTTSLDDIEGMASAGQNAQLLEQELQGEAIPEEFRGKKLNDVLGVIQNLKIALRTSEDARTQALATTQLLAEQRQAPAASSAPAQVEPEEKEPTATELKAMYDEDPFKYQQYMFERMEKRLSRGVDSRVAPVTSTAASMAEQQVRAKFQEEFQLLGKEINDFVSMAFPTPEARATLAQPEAWERVVKYVRGENIDKIIAHREAQKASNAAVNRQRAERDAAPPSLGGSSTPAARGKLTPATMDDTAKEIARKLMPDLPPAKAFEEYCKHYV